MTNKTEIRQSGGDVSADDRVRNRAEQLAKINLAAQILKVAQGRHLDQSATGRVLKIPQPKVSHLLNGRVDGFSTDRLMRYLNTLGCDVQIRVSKPQARRTGRIKVLES